MYKELQKIQQAAAGLLYRSEGDYPFEVVHLKGPSSSLEQELITLAIKDKDVKVEQVTLEHFFRNMVRVYPGTPARQKAVAGQFQKLQQLLQQELGEVRVYRVGEVEIDAFIIGKLPDGTTGGLRTKVIET